VITSTGFAAPPSEVDAVVSKWNKLAGSVKYRAHGVPTCFARSLKRPNGLKDLCSVAMRDPNSGKVRTLTLGEPTKANARGAILALYGLLTTSVGAPFTNVQRTADKRTTFSDERDFVLDANAIARPRQELPAPPFPF
jgi:hypothetical protein